MVMTLEDSLIIESSIPVPPEDHFVILPALPVPVTVPVLFVLLLNVLQSVELK